MSTNGRAARRRALSIALAAVALLQVGSAPARAAEPEQPGDALDLPWGERIAEVRVDVPEGSSVPELASLIAVSAGEPLSRRELGRTVERLWGTGRFASVQVVSQADAEGLHLSFVLTPRRYAERVEYVSGTVLSQEAMRQAADLPERHIELYPELLARVEERLRAAHARLGYPNARILAVAQPGPGEELTLKISAEAGAPLLVSEVSLGGDSALPTARLLGALGIAPGQVFNQLLLDEGLRRVRELLREARCFRARVGQPEITIDARGAHLLLPIATGPRLRFGFEGARILDEAELTRALAYTGEEPLDDSMVHTLAQRLADRYRRYGYADIKVNVRERQIAESELELVFTLFEGEPLRVASVRFSGSRFFTEAALYKAARAVLREEFLERQEDEEVPGDSSVVTGAAPIARHSRPPVVPEQVYYEPAWRAALGNLIGLYRGKGFLSASIALAELSRDERRHEVRLHFRVDEGVRTFVKEVLLEGWPEEHPRPALGLLAPGEPFVLERVEEARVTLERALAEFGYLYAVVVERVEFSPDRTLGSVEFSMLPGPRVRIGRILVEGNVKTKESTIRAALGLREGEVVGSTALAESQRNLVRLEIFRSVSVTLGAPELSEETKDLFVTVEERVPSSLIVGGGFSLIDGPRAFAEYSRANLFGRALSMTARAKVNYFNWSLPVLSDPQFESEGIDALGRHLLLSFQYPRVIALLPDEVGLRLDLLHERVNRPAYGFDRTAAILGGELLVTRSLTTSLQYEIETDYVDKSRYNEGTTLTRTDEERLRFDKGRIDMHSIRPSATLDLRDDPANPSRGTMMSVTTELVQSLGGRVTGPDGAPEEPFSLFIKASAQLNGYVPLWRRVVLALSLKGGRVFPLESTSRTVPPKRFFLGGASSMRGFLDDAMIPEDSRRALHEQVMQCDAVLNKTGCSSAAKRLREGKELLSEGGELYMLARGELRFPLLWRLDGALFLDAGNLWLDPTAGARDFRLRTATGFGIRLLTPIGPAAIDLGINLDPDELLNESRFVPHFSIGLF